MATLLAIPLAQLLLVCVILPVATVVVVLAVANIREAVKKSPYSHRPRRR